LNNESPKVQKSKKEIKTNRDEGGEGEGEGEEEDEERRMTTWPV